MEKERVGYLVGVGTGGGVGFQMDGWIDGWMMTSFSFFFFLSFLGWLGMYSTSIFPYYEVLDYSTWETAR